MRARGVKGRRKSAPGKKPELAAGEKRVSIKKSARPAAKKKRLMVPQGLRKARRVMAAPQPTSAPRIRKTVSLSRESKENRRARTGEIIARLEAAYPDAQCALHHDNPFQLLVATILSAQCTDARVNMVTPGLFARFPDARAFAEADLEELEGLIKSTGFFHNKARNLIGCSQALVMRHGGEVPRDLDALVALPGVGRKTANVVLGNAFDIPGLVVDTHVTRLSQLLRLTSEDDPNKIESDLMEIVPQEKWTLLAHLFIEHGRRICIARRPQCGACVLSNLCPSSRV
jgi:endonuclease III